MRLPQWLRRTWSGLLSIGGVLTILDVLTGRLGVAADLLSSLQRVGLDLLPGILRITALVLLPPFAWVALLTMLSAVGASVRWLVVTYDTVRANDRWASRTLRAYEPRIKSLQDALSDDFAGLVRLGHRPDLRIHLQRLATDLAALGVCIEPDDVTNASSWHYTVTALMAYAAYGDIEGARSAYPM